MDYPDRSSAPDKSNPEESLTTGAVTGAVLTTKPESDLPEPEYPDSEGNGLMLTSDDDVEPNGEVSDDSKPSISSSSDGDIKEGNKEMQVYSELARQIQERPDSFTSTPVGSGELQSSADLQALNDARVAASVERRILYDVLDVWEETFTTEKLVVGQPLHHPRLYEGKSGHSGQYHANCIPPRVLTDSEEEDKYASSPEDEVSAEECINSKDGCRVANDPDHIHNHDSALESEKLPPSRVLSRRSETGKTLTAKRRVKIGWVRIPADRVNTLAKLSVGWKEHLSEALKLELEYYRNLPGARELVEAQERAEKLAAENLRLKKSIERANAREIDLEKLVKHQLKAIEAVTVTAIPNFSAQSPIPISKVSEIASGVPKNSAAFSSPSKHITKHSSGTLSTKTQSPSHQSNTNSQGLAGLSRARVLALATSGLTDERRSLAQELIAAQQTKAALALALDEARKRTASLQRITDEAVSRLEASESLYAEQTSKLAQEVTTLSEEMSSIVTATEASTRSFASTLGSRAEAVLKAIMSSQEEVSSSFPSLNTVSESVDALNLLCSSLSSSVKEAHEERAKWEDQRVGVESRWRKREELATIASHKRAPSREASSGINIGSTAVVVATQPLNRIASSPRSNDITAFHVQPQESEINPIEPTVSRAFVKVSEHEASLSSALDASQAAFSEVQKISKGRQDQLRHLYVEMSRLREELESDIANYLEEVSCQLSNQNQLSIRASDLAKRSKRTHEQTLSNRARTLAELDQQEKSRRIALEHISSELSAKITMVTTSINDILSLRSGGSSKQTEIDKGSQPSLIVEAVSGLTLADLEELRQQELASLRSLLDLYKTQDARLRARVDDLERSYMDMSSKSSQIKVSGEAKDAKIDELEKKLSKWSDKAKQWMKMQNDYEADRAQMHETQSNLMKQIEFLQNSSNAKEQEPSSEYLNVEKVSENDEESSEDESYRQAVWHARLNAIVEKETELSLTQASADKLRSKVFADARQLQIELDSIQQALQREANMVKQTLIVLANELYGSVREADEIVADAMTNSRNLRTRLTSFQRALRDIELSPLPEERSAQLAVRNLVQDQLSGISKEEEQLENIRSSQVRQAGALTKQRELILARLMQLDEAVSTAQSALDARLEAEARARVSEGVITVLDATTQTNISPQSPRSAITISIQPASPISRSVSQTQKHEAQVEPSQPLEAHIVSTPSSVSKSNFNTPTASRLATSQVKRTPRAMLLTHQRETGSTKTPRMHDRSRSTSATSKAKPPLVIVNHDQDWQD